MTAFPGMLRPKGVVPFSRFFPWSKPVLITLRINVMLFFKISEVTKENMRGILVFVLNQRTGVPMAVRAFDTYASKEEGGTMIKFIEELQDGRIVCMAIKVIYI